MLQSSHIEGDHRQIGKRLDLFHFDAAAPGMVFWRPRGWQLYRTIEQHIRAHYRAGGFHEIKTPQLLKRELWQQSGHWDKFADNMFVGGALAASQPAEYALKPMSCPAHIMSFKHGVHSYRKLPYRLFEFGLVHRNEASGALSGCMRLRQFTQDDAHVFCSWEHVTAEVRAFFDRVTKVYRAYGYDQLSVKLSTRPQQSLGSAALWRRAEQLLADASAGAGLAPQTQIGEGAFYGPKLELSLSDGQGRQWQCGTIQLDFNLPVKFGLRYRDAAPEQTPVILHQAILGSLERWVGIMLEASGGALPFWVAPVQVAVANVDRESLSYVEQLSRELETRAFRVENAFGEESLGRKIRRLTQLRVPVLLLAGAREQRQAIVKVRRAGARDNHTVERSAVVDYLEKLAE
ncbi:threonine--tRNA ligase [Exilibacterium tricleocarpae]|uniref:Threonine--tRNA ligase n=1 Tax=Exilibacterium tricleocarpae TaxID=2591008 RepID=A0A545SYS9_9GAMM|nr:threonine--tRNA ligase [Exilibacterium tricleocarpae]TQV70117.1 threonine--tRNA ligase [Exilibacterium tricleocarpae]